MTSRPLISVIIPLKEQEEFVNQSLISVIEQTYSPLEVILVARDLQIDSIKKAEVVINLWKQKPTEKIRDFVFLKQENKDTMLGINEALQKASGHFLTILPAQDYFHVERLEKLIRKMTPSISMIFSRVIGVDFSNQPLPLDHLWKIRYEQSLFDMIEMPTLELNFLNTNLAATFGNLLFTKKLFEKVGNFRSFSQLAGLDFILRSIPAFEISFLNESLYYQRIKLGSLPIEDNHEDLSKIQIEYFKNLHQCEYRNPNAPSPEKWFQNFYVKNRTHKQKTNLLEQLVHQSSPDTDEVSHKKVEKIPQGKKITLVTQNLALGGGIPKLILDLSISLKENGFRPNVVSLDEGPMREEFDKQNIPVKIIPPFLRWTEKKGRLRKILSLLGMIFYANFKTSRHIVVNSSAASLFTLPFVLFSNFKKLTWYIHESFSPIVYLKTNFERSLLKKGIHKKTFSFWFGSESTRHIWNSAVGVNGIVLYWSGIKETVNRQSDFREIKNLLAVGTVNFRKGTHYLVDAFIDCVKNKRIENHVTLTIIGMPKQIDFLSGEIILKIYSHQLQDRIKLISCVSSKEMDAYYRNADLFLQTSLLECLPLSLLKAMSEGIPIISTDVNGCAEAISHGQTGYLCRPFSHQALVEMIEEALNNPEKTRSMGKSAKKAFDEKFSLAITVPKVIEELNKL